MIGHGFQVHCAMLWLGYVTADSTSLSVFYLTAAEEACTGVYITRWKLFRAETSSRLTKYSTSTHRNKLVHDSFVNTVCNHSGRFWG